MTSGLRSIMASGFCMKARAAVRVQLIAIVLVTRRVVRSSVQGMVDLSMLQGAVCVLCFGGSVPVGWIGLSR